MFDKHVEHAGFGKRAKPLAKIERVRQGLGRQGGKRLHFLRNLDRSFGSDACKHMRCAVRRTRTSVVLKKLCNAFLVLAVVLQKSKRFDAVEADKNTLSRDRPREPTRAS